MTFRRFGTLLLGAGIVTLLLAASLGGARRRVVLVWLQATGAIPDMSWGDILAMMPPRSGYSVESLIETRNPYAVMENPFTDSSEVAAGEASYRSNCSACHGGNAEGGIGPALNTGPYRRGSSDWALFRTIRLGVPGTAMQAHALPRRTTWQVIAYLRRVNKSASPVTQPASTHTDPAILAMASAAPDSPSAPRATLPEPRAVSAADLHNASANPAEWLTYSGGLSGQRHSRLAQLNRDNAFRIKPRWVVSIPGGRTKYETSPLVIGSTMYLTSPSGVVRALDTRTGSLRWSTAERVLPGDLRLCCGYVNRGLAAFGNTLYLGTLDAHLIALDARTGTVLWEKEVADYHAGYSITGAPLAVDGRVIVGIAGGEFGIRGFLDAYDASTGRHLWRFYTIPGPGEPGHETWGGEASWKRGGAPTWMTGTVDPELGLVYWGVGNPGPNYQGDVRSGDNLYSNSVVALDLASGALRWYFQFTPHDEHDWDATETPILADAVIDGKQRKLLLEANRNGFYYVLDRETGAFLTARPFVQQSWADSLNAAGRPIVRPGSRPSARGTLLRPDVVGGTNWWAPTYDPGNSVFYVQAREGQGLFFNSPDPEESAEGWYMGSTATSPGDLLDFMAVRALDAKSGALLWEHRYTPMGSDYLDAGVGGLLSTAGGLVFGGSNSRFFALDAKTGTVSWEIETGGAIWAAPITYLSDGIQQVSIAAGNRIITFSLDGR